MLSQRDPGPEKRPPGHRKITLLRICLLYIYIYTTNWFILSLPAPPPSFPRVRPTFFPFDSPLLLPPPLPPSQQSRLLSNRFELVGVVGQYRPRYPREGGGRVAKESRLKTFVHA